MGKQIQLYRKRIIIFISIIVLLVTAVGSLPTPKTEAWGTSAPDNGVLRLRIGKDGRTNNIPLRVYYTAPQTNPTITIQQAPIDYADEDEGSCAGNSATNIRMNGQEWDCDEQEGPFAPRVITLPSTGSTHAPGLPGYYMSDANIGFVGNLNPGCRDDKNSNHRLDDDGNVDHDDDDNGCVDFKFTAWLNSAPGGSLITMDRSINDDNGFTAWGAHNYTVPFGPPPSACNQSSVPGRVGVVDPDSDDVRLHLDRVISGSWTEIAAFDVAHGSGEDSREYNFTPGERYRIRLTGVKAGNTVVLLWPFPTIYGEVSLNCWNVNTSSTVTASPAGPGSTSTDARVIVNPDAPGSGGSGSATWTHTASNGGVVNTPPLTLTYQRRTFVPGTGWTAWSEASPSWNTSIPAGGSRTRTPPTLSIPKNTVPGTQYCQRMRASQTSFRNSSPTPWTSACVTVVWPETRPYFQVFGGDVNSLTNAVVGSTTGSIRAWPGTPLSGNGARGQIAALARGTIAGFATASGIGGSPVGHRLSFAHPNAGGAGNFCGGCYAPVGLPAATTSSNVTISSYNDSDLTNAAVSTTGSIYIDGNITAPTSFGLDSLKFPRLAATGNIYIAPNVTQIDANLQAGGAIYTCAFGFSAPSALRIARECRRTITGGVTGPERSPLRINGSMSAARIKLFRSSGNLNQPNPAETIDYVPTAWLQAISGAGMGGLSGTYDAHTSLPPVL